MGILKQWLRVDFSFDLVLVFTPAMALNPRSQSAVLTGMIRKICASLDN